MHVEAYDGARKMIAASGLDPNGVHTGLDLGGVDVNGSARDLLPNTTWTGLDIEAGPGVDVVADARTWTPGHMFDVVLCTELLEHVEQWRDCLATAASALRAGGVVILTCASTGRRPHGARGGVDPEPGEWYGNVDPDAIHRELTSLFPHFEVTYNPDPGDCYAWART